jgi:hypothetical protein
MFLKIAYNIRYPKAFPGANDQMQMTAH